MRRIALATVFIAIGVASCGGGITLSEYADRLERSLAAMNAQIDGVDVRLEAVTSVDEARSLWDERVAAREALLAEFESIDPPEQAAELHHAALDILRRLTAAEAAMGVRAAEFEDVSELGDNIWLTEEGRAAVVIDEEAIAICQAAQAAFDETADREKLADVPWISSELKEVVDVVFGCTAAER